MKKILFSVILLLAVVIAILYTTQKLNDYSKLSNMTFDLNVNEIECYRVGFVNIDLRLNMTNDSWNKNLLLSKAKCQYYKTIEDYPYQIEAIGTVSNETPDYTSSLSVKPNLKDVYFYGLYSLEYSEECLIVSKKMIYSQIWRGGEREPLVSEGTSRCRWLSDEEVRETLH